MGLSLHLQSQNSEAKDKSITGVYNLLTMPTGPSGYQNHYADGRPVTYDATYRNYDVYTAGLSEEEQLERALRASIWDRGRSLVPSSYFKTSLMARWSEEGLFAAN
jgi:hypothetical protein